MVLTLTATLLAHQRGLRRKPDLIFEVSQTRFGVPVLPFALGNSNSEPQAPVDAVRNTSGDLVIARNNAGALDTTRDYGATWTNRDTVTSGQGFAVRWDPTNAVFGLLYGDGNDLKFRTSADGGATWSGATTIVTEASAIGAVALAFDNSGNACAFYVLGTTTTLKRLRRTGAAWAAAGTTWTKTADVATLTGVSAVWAVDFALVITGTEVTTTHERCWAVKMGDTGLPANVWSGFRNIAEADAAAAVTFAHPHLALVAGVPFATFQQAEAGNVVASRVMLTHTTAAADPLGHWREPAPPAAVNATMGAAIAVGSPLLELAGPRSFYQASLNTPTDFSARVLSASWRETPESLRLRLELDDHDGNVLSDFNLALGYDVLISHGFVSDGPDPEYGVTLLANISRITRKFEPGKLTAIVEADGPWEALARSRATQAWTAPAATTRAVIFQRLAGRAGLDVTAAGGALAPSAAWSETPEFAIAANETGRATLQRLLAATPDFLRAEGAAGAFQICGLDPIVGNDVAYQLPQTDPEQHPIFAFTLAEELGTNWIRLQGPDRYADDFGHEAGYWSGEIAADWPGHPPMFELVRDQHASSDALVTFGAEAALLRRRILTPAGELVVPVHVGHELYDTLSVQVTQGEENLVPPDNWRVIGRGVDFKRATTGPVFNSVLQLGRL